MTTEAPNAGVREADALPYLPCELRTERLILRPLTKNDLDDMHAAYQKRKDVVRYLRWEVHDHDEPRKNLEKRIAMSRLAEAGDGIIYSVALRQAQGTDTEAQGTDTEAADEETSRVIGDMSVFLKSAKHSQFEMGWVFHPLVYGRGMAAEAARALLELCFDALGAHRVFAELDSRNEASARLCEQLGMRQEALLHERELVDGEWHDMAIYGLLESEYRAATA